MKQGLTQRRGDAEKREEGKRRKQKEGDEDRKMWVVRNLPRIAFL